MENTPRPARTTTMPFVNSTVATVRTPLMCAGSSITRCGIMGCGILGRICDSKFSCSPRRGKPRLYTSFSFDSQVCWRTAARNSSAISRAALWAASPWATSNEIAPTRACRPRVRPDRNLYPERTLADADAVNRIRMKIVGNEFVVAFEVEVGDVEKNRAVFFYAALPQNLDGPLVAFEQRRQDGGNEWFFKNAGERLVGKQRNHRLDEVAVGGGFDGHGQLHGRSFHLHRRLRVFVHGAVDDVGPLDQLGNWAGIEAEAVFRE